MYSITTSSRKDKKLQVTTPEGKTIHFGAKGYSDYTIHKDAERKDRYISRHQSKEDWSKSGINTAGFWSKHILWNKPTIDESLNDTIKTFKIKIAI